MLLDRYNRRTDYLRISVTDRCNQRCIYCMPEAHFVHKHSSEILSYEQIEAVKVDFTPNMDAKSVCVSVMVKSSGKTGDSIEVLNGND